MATRSKHPIATEEVPRIFDDACIEGLAQIGKPPASADMKRFAEGIREAACIYATDVREPNDNEVRAEVEKLYLAAERRHYDQVAILLETLSTKASRGGGPPYQLFGPRVLYRWGDALKWAQARLSTPRRSTSEGDASPAPQRRGSRLSKVATSSGAIP